jgi:hypothetical protein
MALANLLIGGLLVSIVRTRPAIMKIANEREAAKAAGRRDDMDDMRKRITDLEAKVEAANATSLQAKMQMTYVTAALGMVSAELERRDPGNPVIKQAREMVAQATNDDDTFGTELRKLATVKGVGE